MSLINDITDGFQKNARSIGLAAVMLTAPLLGYGQYNQKNSNRQSKQSGIEQAPKQYKNGQDSINHQRIQRGVASIYLNGQVDVDTAAGIRWSYNAERNRSDYWRWDETKKADTLVEWRQMSKHFGKNYANSMKKVGKNLDSNDLDHYSAIELMHTFELAAETPTMQKIYGNGEYLLNPANKYYTGVRVAHSDSPYGAGVLWIVGAQSKLPFLKGPINNYFGTTAELNFNRKNPNRLGASYSYNTPWESGHVEFQVIPIDAVGTAFVSTGHNSPIIAKAAVGVNCRDFGYNLINYADFFTEVQLGVRLGSNSVLSAELFAFQRNEKYNKGFTHFVNDGRDGFTSRGIEARLTFNPSNFYTMSTKAGGPVPSARDGFYTSVGYTVSDNPTMHGSFVEVGFKGKNPILALGHNPFLDKYSTVLFGQQNNKTFLAMGAESSALSTAVWGVQGKVNFYSTETEFPDNITTSGKAFAGVRLRPDRNLAFEITAFGIVEQFNDKPGQSMTYGNGKDIGLGAGMEFKASFRPFAKKEHHYAATHYQSHDKPSKSKAAPSKITIN